MKFKLVLFAIGLLIAPCFSVESKLNLFELSNKNLIIDVNDEEEPTPNKVSVEIFYETLNPTVRKFFIEQFELVKNHLFDHLELKLYPYGNTKKENENYVCPYGDEQCRANVMHACVLKQDDGDFTKPVTNYPANFVQCFFRNRKSINDALELGDICKEMDENLEQCIETDSATLNQQLETITGSLTELTDGLAIRINNEVDESAKTDLLKSICNLIDDATVNHPICQTTRPNKLKVSVYYGVNDSSVKDYFLRQLHPYFHVLEDMIDLDLIPFGDVSLSETYECSLNDFKCFSLKFQALTISQYLIKETPGDPVSGANRALDFINCLYQQTAQTFDQIDSCSMKMLKADQYRDYFEKIQLNGDEVAESMSLLKDKLANIPTNQYTVAIDGVLSSNASNDIVAEVCNQYKIDDQFKPQICKKTKVVILYEPLDHKSRTLFLEQVKPVFNNLHNLIEFELLPSGRAQFFSDQKFVCKNGESQCTAMKLQACAIDFLWNDGSSYDDPVRQEVMDFIVCTFKNIKMLDATGAVEYCSEVHLEADSWMTIHGCLADGTYNGILMDYIEKTSSYLDDIGLHGTNLTEIPIIIIDGVKLEDLTTLQTTLCKKYDEYHSPDYCDNDPASKININVYYQSDSEFSKSFFTTQVNPWYRYIEEMVNVNLIPGGNDKSFFDNGTCQSYAQNSVCFANTIQAYIIDEYSKHDDGDYVDGQYRIMNYLSCVFAHPHFVDNVIEAAEVCSEKTLLADSFFDLIISAKSEVGIKLYQNSIQITKEFQEKMDLSEFPLLPWVTIDGDKHSYEVTDDLLQTICQRYTGETIPECTPVTVEVYYKSIDPQTRKFFIDELIPTFRHLRERLQLKLIPYGVPDENSDVTSDCEANSILCMTNKLQACAIKDVLEKPLEDNSIVWDPKNQTFSFIHCMFKNIQNFDVETLGEKCANGEFVLADRITACAKQNESVGYLTSMRDQTLGLFNPMQSSPWVVINSEQVPNAQFNLQKEVCDRLTGEKPDVCGEERAEKVKMTFHYSSMDAQSADYVVNTLYPSYRGLEEIVDLDIVPFGLTDIIKNDNGQYTLRCPNGPDECTGNIIHACVYNQFWLNETNAGTNIYNQFDSKLQTIEFINCYFRNSKYPSNIVEAASECVEQTFGDYWPSILEECVRTNKGPELLYELEVSKVDTLLPHLAYVPWITVNGRHNYAVENHLNKAICDTYKGAEKPLTCYTLQSKDERPLVTIHYEPRNTKSKHFFTTYLTKNLNQIGDVEFIPFGRSTKKTDSEFQCVDNAECDVFKEHACVMNSEDYKAESKIKFLSCVFQKQFSEPNLENSCFDEVFTEPGNDWSQIHDCAHENGNALLEQHYATVQNLDPSITHVPWILINGEHSLNAEVNLMDEVCNSYYTHDRPADCIPQELTNVEIYYQNDDASVATFMLNQLPVLSEYLDEIGNFSYYPYGLTKRDGDGFKCQSTNQCLLNKVHACVLNKYYNDPSDVENRIRTTEFIICSIDADPQDPVSTNKGCFQTNFPGQSWDDIEDCANGNAGNRLYSQMADKTEKLSPALTSVPHVVLNDTYSSKSAQDLFQTVCDSYQLVKPQLCSSLPSKAVKVGVYFSFNDKGKSVLKNQLLSFYPDTVPVLFDDDDNSESDAINSLRIRSLIDADLVPWGETVYNEKDSTVSCATEDECKANRYLACAAYYHARTGQEPKGRLHYTEFALCMATHNGTIDEAASFCSNKIWVLDDSQTLKNCATSNEKEYIDIYLKMKDKTENNYPELKEFPSITIDNQVNADALNNLMKVTCLSYKGVNHPSECDEYLDDSTETTTIPGETTTSSSETITIPTETTTNKIDTTTNIIDTTTNIIDTTTNLIDTTTNLIDTTTNPGDTTTNPSETTTNPPGGASSITVSIILLFISFICILLQQ